MREILQKISREIEICRSRFNLFSAVEKLNPDRRQTVQDFLYFARQYVEIGDDVGAKNALDNACGEAADLGCMLI